MKKTILLIAVVLAAGVVSGQKTFTFGPKVGINIADCTLVPPRIPAT